MASNTRVIETQIAACGMNVNMWDIEAVEMESKRDGTVGKVIGVPSCGISVKIPFIATGLISVWSDAL